MGKFMMLGMDEEHGRFLYELVKKEIDTIDVVFEKVKCCDGLEWLQNRRKIADQTKDLLSFVFYP